ncbi:uncharacterized protein TNCV_1500081 [Trichonephila clavipes]|nr:uncharacterized protein TNCV_1500081 [Trichonephila clavipes]
MMIGDVQCLGTNPASNCVLTIIKDVSADAQGSVKNLLSLRPSTRSYGLGCHFFIAGPLWSSLEAQRYIDHIMRNVLLLFLLQYLAPIFQQYNARPHMTRVVMNSLKAFQTLPWPVRSPDLSLVVHVWDMMG